MSVLELELEQAVAKPANEVWAFIADGYFAHHAKWDHAIVGMTQLSAGPIAVGTRGLEARRAGGRLQESEFEVMEFSAPRRFAFRNVTGPFELDRAYELRPHATGTVIRFRFRMAPKGMMRLLFPVLRGAIESQVRANVARFAELLGEQP